MTRRERVLLALLVGIRVALASMRLIADPLRFWNTEEAYNATLGWYLAHGGLWSQLPLLQYRSFCGGCSVVSVAASPLMALSDNFLLWKLVPLCWTAATMIAGFFALRSLVGQASAWAFVTLMALPPVGASDLATMAWGNHQETALLTCISMILMARGLGGATGLSLGLSVWFARTAVYEVIVLLPAAIWLLKGQRQRVLLGFGIGIATVFLPTAGGDGGYYRMDATAGELGFSGAIGRAATLFSPAKLGARLYPPLANQTLAATALLASAAVGAGFAALSPGPRIFLALAGSYASLYSLTHFPLFVVGSRAPINNIRYHAPWVFVLTLVIAVGAGAAWERSFRRIAVGIVSAAVLASVPAWVSVAAWPTDLGILAMRATDDTRFVMVASPRFDPTFLATASPANPHGAEMFRRMFGLRRGDEVRRGKRSRDQALADVRSVSLNEPAMEGFGEAVTEVCPKPSDLNTWLASLPAREAEAIGRGAAITLSLCKQSGDSVAARIAQLSPSNTSNPCWLCAAAGEILFRHCAPPPTQTKPAVAASEIGACIARETSGQASADELLFGTGLRFGNIRHSTAEIEAIAAAIGPSAAFLAGARHPMAGMEVAYTAGRPR